MPKVVECVPNFSEGRSKEVIEGIAKAIAATPGCTLLDVDPGPSTNRTVYTFVGSPDDVVKGALAAALAAAQLIDMTQHAGEHPRLGALDVCPFIPVQDVTMDECVECAKQFAASLATALHVPVYMYGFASDKDYRKSVPQIRSGEYEGLRSKLQTPGWEPDFGPAEFVPSWGATIAGARNFLVAYNVNVLGTKEQAHRIALNIREQGRSPSEPGRLKNVQAIGWYLQESNIAQVSVNITDITTTPIHVVYEECLKDAKALNLTVVGSEIVGLVPKSCMLQAADYYIERDNLFVIEEEHKIRLAIDRLGLHSIKQFDPKEKIIEYMLPSDDSVSPYTTLSVKQFVTSVASRTAVPGGGSVAALIGSLGSGLSAMAALLTYGNKKFESLDSKMREIIPSLYQTAQQLVPFIDADSLAYDRFMDANKLPSNTEDERIVKEKAKDEALDNAIRIPLTLAQSISKLWPIVLDLAPIVNVQCKSDLEVGVRCLETAVWGAYYNVITNTKNVKDPSKASEIKESVEKELRLMQTQSKAVLDILASRE